MSGLATVYYEVLTCLDGEGDADQSSLWTLPLFGGDVLLGGRLGEGLKSLLLLTGDCRLAGEGERRLGDGDRRLGDGDRRLGDGDRRLGDGDRRLGDGDRRLGDGERRLTTLLGGDSDGDRNRLCRWGDLLLCDVL